MNTEQQRKEFKKWLETVKYDNSNILSPSGLAWEAWQAAQKGLTEQRDRRAEALQKLADCDWVITPHDRMDAVRTIAREALQSLTNPNEL
jgi:hypothetical protein